MAQINIIRYDSYSTDRQGRVTSAGVIYRVRQPGTNDPAAIIERVNQASPDYLGRARKSALTLHGIDAGAAPSYADVSVSYEYSSGSSGTGGADGSGSVELDAFDCSASTVHINTALSQRKSSGAPDAGLLIGWNGRSGDAMQVAGVDIVSPVMRETYTRVFRKSKLSTSFKRRIGKLTGKVNSGSFRGWNDGEVLFLGATYSAPDGEGNVAVTFNFSIIPNGTVSVGDLSLFKDGHDYAWTISETTYDNSGNPQVKVKGLYSATVYGRASFGGLGI